MIIIVIIIIIIIPISIRIFLLDKNSIKLINRSIHFYLICHDNENLIK